MTETALLIGIGIAGGFVAGLLGLGGAVVLAPLLLTVPASLGMKSFAMRDVASITLVYGLLWAAVSLWSRGLPRAAGLRPALLPGLVGAGAGLAGGLLSARLPGRTLLLLYAAFATLAALLLLVPRWPARHRRVRRPRPSWGAVAAAAGTGMMAGLVGAAGGFLLEPLVARTVRSRRVAETAVVGIVLLSAAGGLAGKGLTGQLNLWLAGPLVGGAVPAAWWGGVVARELSPRRLAWAALACTWAAAAGLWLLVLPELGARVRPGHLYLLAMAPAALAALWLAGRRGWGLAVAGPRIRAPGRAGSADRPAALLPEELRRLVVEGPTPQIVDLREPEAFARSSLPGSLNIPWSQLEAWLEVADPQDGALFVCEDGVRSARAASLAAARGFRTRYLEGGMAAWEALQAELPPVGDIPGVVPHGGPVEVEGPPGLG
ncbi:putative membrane protein YfcA/rhodanese-related sulfurtransferase [Symbiobacterium terraclitae]|uniref:Probable membrane transporter protein n=1 Tax=Symbiobacterium terraclitae TaxID=557451 RepID=A0ABS4JRP2_9FIRM|nr:TSUP family transporter [Symbiobacterium terraclitae]MBP2018203.1 putative membrane protein YfcA/rhodanese-related sulfurtransferase [Symbiobacterium terraclitae]